jgi:hypothetical protein
MRMKHTPILLSILAIAACGGKKPAPEAPKTPDETGDSSPPPPSKRAAPAPEPEAPAPPPPPKSWHAQAELKPVKGAKLKPATVTFAQDEGDSTKLGSIGWFDGIKPGKYHLVVHEAADCGPNATKAGKPMAGGDISFAAVKGESSLEIAPSSAMPLDGDGAIVGHALVLHDDRRGKAGKVLACGAITAAAE